jgi:acyl-CoA dehydrogenase
MADALAWCLWTAALAGVAVTLAYRRVDLATSTLVLGFTLLVYSLFGPGFLPWKLFLWVLFGGLLLLNAGDFRRERLALPLLRFYRTVVPQLSDTEREALEAGTVWWDGELFTGSPDWSRLMALPAPALTPEEQAFLDGPTEELCRLSDDWQITHELADLPPPVWECIRRHRFFAMIIPKRYGGLEFSPVAVATVLAKLSSRSAVVASTVGVPNSLGPAELLLHYGTEAQRQRYLPGLAAGTEIPCFALTGPRVGSDAAAIPDTGIVCRGQWQGEEITGIRLNWDKRYITLAPVATVLGLAFKLYDPDRLIGDREELGITAALVPVTTPGVEIGRRHFPLNVPFQNGPTRGRDVFVPLDAIIGGLERAGQGWKMLVEQLSAGRGITLPSSALGSGKAAVWASGAYARLRRQFNLPVAEFEGVAEALARMAGHTYIVNAALAVTATAIGRGEKPAVPSAVLKYHCTELGRKIANDAMDVHGGRGIMLGPKNYLARNYQGVPIAITVEGANILTRSLIIFGQGAVRCHPFVLREMAAARDTDFQRGLRDFDRYVFGHIGYAISNAARSFVLALTNARASTTPVDGPTARFYQHVNRYSAAFALAADVSMLVLGGKLKRKEMLSGRLGDVFSALYLASMVLKHWEDQGREEADLPLVEWSCRTLLYQAQEQLHGFLRNFPNRAVAAALRVCIFPRGRMYSAPGDELGLAIVALVSRPTAARARLCAGIYAARDGSSPLGELQRVLELAEEALPLEGRIRDAIRAGLLPPGDAWQQGPEALARGLISAAEAAQLAELDAAVQALVAVDDFAPGDLGRAPAA